MELELTGDFTAADARLVIAACSEVDALELVIDGPGGDGIALLDTLAAVEAMQAAGGHVTTRVRKRAMSAHAILFAAGNRRILHEGAVVMVHPSSTPQTSGNRHDLQQSVTALAAFDSHAASVLQRATGVDRPLAEQWTSTETWFAVGGGEGVIDALACGLATETAPATREAERALADCYGMARARVPSGLRRAADEARGRICAAALASCYARRKVERMELRACRDDIVARVRMALRERFHIRHIPPSALYGSAAWQIGLRLAGED